MRVNSNLTSERLHQVLSYNRRTGIFKWRDYRGKSGPAGTTHNGYVIICFDCQPYPAHRLAWFYVHGKWPDDDIDHINRVRNDNRLANLREAPRTANLHNQRQAHRDSKSGLLGVCPDRNRWRAHIMVNYRPIYLGSFGTPEEAHAAYLKAKQQYHPTAPI